MTEVTRKEGKALPRLTVVRHEGSMAELSAQDAEISSGIGTKLLLRHLSLGAWFPHPCGTSPPPRSPETSSQATVKKETFTLSHRKWKKSTAQ